MTTPTIDFVSHSQVGQDRWVWETLGPGPGTFLDIGCGFPVEGSNTYALERMGWNGILIDSNQNLIDARHNVRALSLCLDATKIHWDTLTTNRAFDYLSLDIDDVAGEPSKVVVVLRALLDADYRFRAATIEHDRYRVGDGARDAIREMLTTAGYRLAVADVAHDGCAFEDWWLR